MKKILWMIYGQGGRMVFQTFYFLLLAVVLGPTDYGAFVIVSSILIILGPFCGMGFNSILTRDISAGKNNFPELFGSAIKVTFYSYFCLLLIGEFIILLIFGNENNYGIIALMFLILSVADLFFLKLNEMSAQIYIAKNYVKRASHIFNFISLSRFLSVFSIFLFANSENAMLIMWVITYFAFSLILSIVVYIGTLRKVESPVFSIPLKMSQLKEGVFFSIGLSSQGVYNDIDKTLLGRFESANVTGHYGFAYKVLDVLFIPVKAILALTFPMFFKVGEKEGVYGTYRLAKKVLIPLFFYCIASVIIAYYFFPIIIELVFPAYTDSIKYFTLLLPIVVLRVFHYVFADALTGAGFQKERSYVQIFIAVFNFLLSFILILTFSIYGAIYASLISDALMLLTISLLLLKKVKNEKSRNI
ncbi:oligosaccharide flippase family protein [Bacillus sp. FSL K6-0047]